MGYSTASVLGAAAWERLSRGTFHPNRPFVAVSRLARRPHRICPLAGDHPAAARLHVDPFGGGVGGGQQPHRGGRGPGRYPLEAGKLPVGKVGRS